MKIQKWFISILTLTVILNVFSFLNFNVSAEENNYDDNSSANVGYDLDSIKELLTNDENILFDPDTQTFMVVKIDSSVSNNATRLIEKGVLTEEAMNKAMELPIEMTVSINGENAISSKDFCIYNGEGIEEGTKSSDYFQLVSSDKGLNIIILNKGDNCTVSPYKRNLYIGTYKSEEYNPFPTGTVYAAPNPISTEDLNGRECTNIQQESIITFSYGWDLYNFVEIETWFINDDEKIVDFSTDSIGYGVNAQVDYLIEIRDEQGNVTPLPKTIYEDYGDALEVMMEQDGIISQYISRGDYDHWSEGGARVPAGYDFRIKVLNSDSSIGVNFAAYEDTHESAELDDEGFYLAANDFTGDYIISEYFMIPTDEIRVEKIAENTSDDAEFTFNATMTYPVFKPFRVNDNADTYSIFENIKISLSNYSYTLYSSDTNEEVGEYKTSDTGTFTLKNRQYAIFKVWKTSDDFLEYTGTNYFDGYLDLYKFFYEHGNPLNNSAIYTFEEQEVPNCVTTVEHKTSSGTNAIDGTYIDNVNNGDSILFRNVFESESVDTGSLTIYKEVSGVDTPSEDTIFEFTVTKDGGKISGNYSIDGSTEQQIPSNGLIELKAGQTAVLTGLAVGEYTVTEIKPSQENYKSTEFSVNGGEKQTGLSATVTVTATTSQIGGWKKENDKLVMDDDGYFTYTFTTDQITDDGTITVDCDELAEYMESVMRDYQNFSPRKFKVKFINETGTSIQYQDYSFDTVNWMPVGSIYNTSQNLTMLNTNEGSSNTSAGYGWGDVWKLMYSMLIGETPTAGSLDVNGFDGNKIRISTAPLRCINPAIISYFDSNPGKGTLTGNSSTNSAQAITLLQMNAFPELIKEEFTFKNYKGIEVTLPADENRTYSDFICAFYEVNSLDELTVAQKYNVLGTGYNGSKDMPYAGQSHITTYYSNLAGNISNWCVPYSALNDGTLDYFKTWGFSDTRIEKGKNLIAGGQEFSEEEANEYAYQPNYYLLETDPDVLSMSYEYLYSRCIRFSFDNDDRPVSTDIDNSATTNDSVAGIKDYIDKTEETTNNVFKAMGNGEVINDGDTLTLDKITGYIEVPNAWNQFRYYDFGFKLTFKTGENKNAASSITFNNIYEEKKVIPTPTPTPTTIPEPTSTPIPTRKNDGYQLVRTDTKN